MNARLRRMAVTLLGAMLAGCSGLGGLGGLGLKQPIDPQVALAKPVNEIREDRLMDLWIERFDPGSLPEDEEDAAGLSEVIRDAEARYIPQHLRGVIEQSGYWGAVRVVPRGNEGGEVVVGGTILASDGERLELEINAIDATGRAWFEERYELELTPEEVATALDAGREPFQPLYVTIANDLARYRDRLGPDVVRTVRRTADLRFAAAMAPDPFAAYLTSDDKGRTTVARLPALDDPMYRRVLAIRERDHLLIDTLNAHFDNFYREMRPPYDEWRRARSAESGALRAVERASLQRKVLGLAAIIGGIALSASSNNRNAVANRVARDVMVIGGTYAVKRGFDMDSETVIHRDAIAELGDSFSSEAAPLVVEVEGETHELTGSAEAQYAQWRALLKRIYAVETGLVPVDASE